MCVSGLLALRIVPDPGSGSVLSTRQETSASSLTRVRGTGRDVSPHHERTDRLKRGDRPRCREPKELVAPQYRLLDDYPAPPVNDGSHVADQPDWDIDPSDDWVTTELPNY